MTIKGYTRGYIGQYVVADLDGTVVDTFDTREEAEACAEEGQQIVELTGEGYVAEITDGTEEEVFTTDDAFMDAQNAGQQAQPEVPFAGYNDPIRYDGTLQDYARFYAKNRTQNG